MSKTRHLNAMYLISMVFNSSMVLYSLVPQIVVLLLCSLFSIYLFIVLRWHFDNKCSLFLSSVLLVPTSTISILGTSSAVFPLTWFHLFAIILFFLVILTERIRVQYFALLVVFVILELAISLFTPNYLDSLKQILTISLFLVSFIIGPSISKRVTPSFVHIAAKCYLFSTLGFSAQILLQRSFIRATGIIIGHYAAMGVGRNAFAGLMGDYSFATLYLATGCMMAIILFNDWQEISLARFILIELTLLLASLIVTSRTGIMALAIILVFYFFNNAKRVGWKVLFLMMVSMVSIPFLMHKIMSVRGGGQKLLDSSGRLANYSLALHYFVEKPLFGIGLGLNNLSSVLQIAVPHNFFIQYLVQIGIIGLFLIMLFFAIYFLKDYNKTSNLKWVFWIIVVGSMLIPDIFSSRFFFVIIIMCTLPVLSHSNHVSGANYEEKESRSIS